ncbi:MAG: hypothetical protein AB7I30_04455 [Isosphaeraceae bacterium]
MSGIKSLRLLFSALGLSVILAGCGASDNESTMMTDADGKPMVIENEGAAKTYTSSEAAYKATSGQNLQQTKGYRKR